MLNVINYLNRIRAIVILLLFVSPPIITASEAPISIRSLTQTCFNCHGTEGQSKTSIPTLVGQPEKVLRQKLLNYQQQNPSTANTIMSRLVKDLSEKEIHGLARYYSSIAAQQPK